MIQKRSTKEDSNSNTQKRIKISDSDLFAMMEGLQIILESGTDLTSGIDSIAEDATNKNLQSVLKRVVNDLKAGVKLWESMENNHLLPSRNIEVLKIGEESGRLQENIKIIVEQKRFEKELKSQLTSALIYPMIILFIGIGVIVSTVWFILPRLTLVYAGLDVDLPLITRIMIRIGEVVKDINILYVVAGFALFILIIKILSGIKRVKRFVERLILRTPGLGKIVKEVEMSRMGMVLGGLLNVGVTIDKALLSLRDSTPFIIYKEEYERLQNAIISGSSFRSYFKELEGLKRKPSTSLPATVKQIITSAERSSNLPEAFTYLGERAKDNVKLASKNLTIILEPLLLITMWLFVSIIAISIVLPIYTLVGSL